MAAYDLGTAKGTIEIDASTLGRTSAAFDKFGKSLLGIGGLALAGFGVAVAASASFEKTMSGVEAVLAPTATEMEALRKKTLQLGQDTIFSAKEVAEGMEAMAKAGLSADEMINGAADAAVNLAAAAGNMELDRAAEIAANAMRMFNLEAEDMVGVADAMAGAANASTVEVEDLAVSMRYAGSVAAAMGVSFEETNTALAILGDRGIKGSTAGTSLRGVLLSLTGTSNKAKAELEKLGIITEDGSNKFFDAQGNMKSMAEVAQILQDATKGLSEEQRAAAFNTIFQRRAMSSAIILADQGAAGFAKYTAEIQKVSAADVAAKKLDNLSGDIEILRGNLETLLIEQGSVFQDMLRGWVQALTNVVQWFTNLDKGTQKLIMQILLIGGIIATAAGGFVLAVGAMVKFYRATKDLIAGVKLINAGIKLMGKTLLASPVFWIIAGIIALAAAFYLAYTRIEGFRNFVDAAWQAIQKFWDAVTGGAVAAWHAMQRFWDTVLNAGRTAIDWIKANWDILLAILTGPVGAVILVWRRFGDDIVRFVSTAFNTVVGFFQALPGRIIGFLSSLISTIAEFFGSLPGKFAEWGSAAVEAFMGFMSELPYKLGYAIGLALGTLVRWGIDVVTKGKEVGTDFLAAIVEFFTQLPGRILNFVTNAYNYVKAWTTNMITNAREMGSRFISAVVEFFTQLPGKVSGFVTTTATRVSEWVTNMVGKARDLGTRFIAAIVEFFSSLPGKVGGFISDTVAKVGSFVGGIAEAGRNLAINARDGFLNVIRNLPSSMGNILGNVIDAFKDLIRRGFNAAKDFASGLWNGFKKGLGINSPSFIEEAMFSLVDNVGGSLRQFERQVADIKSAGNSLVDLNPAANLRIAEGAGLVTAARSIAPAAPPVPTPAEAREGDTFNIYGADQKSAMEISREIMFEKRVTVGV